MKRIVLILTLLIISIFKGWTQTNTIDYPDDISTEEKIMGLSKLWSEIKYNFVNIDQIDFDPDTLFFEYIPRVLNASNDIEYYDILQQFAAAFNDGHTEVDSPFSWNEYNDYVPFLMEEGEDGIFIVNAREDCLDSTFFKAKVLEVENIPVNQWLETRIYPNISASTEKTKRKQAVMMLHSGPKQTFLNATVKKQDGTIETLHILRNGEQTRNDGVRSWGLELSPPQRSRVQTEWKDQIAILKVKSFHPEETIIDSIDIHMKNITDRHPRGLVIDLRNNGGGSTEAAFHLLNYIIETDTVVAFGSETRINNGYGRSQGNYREEFESYYKGTAYSSFDPETLVIQKDLPKPAVPTVILINENCYSACEDLLVSIYEQENRPLFIGTETGGSTGAPLVIELPGGGIARICTLRIKYPKSNTPFVGKGVIPDRTISPNLEDELGGFDRILEEGINELKKSIDN